MAFQLEPTRTPEEIGTIVVTLKDAPASTSEDGAPIPAYQAAYFQLEIVLSDGTVIKRSGNLVPHLEPGEGAALMGFMDDLRARAITQILGES